ncbi:MAG: FemAB family PEP-CTERM system-associated protein [Aquisalinus sp.]|nr:FemAB family PEP-CTERM system-associated protein [Aquisalinus sp.]
MTAMLKPSCSSPDTQVRVKIADSSAQSEWDRYVSVHPDGSFFHKFGWSDVIHKTYGHQPYYIYTEDHNGAMTGVLPMTLVKSPFFGKSMISTAFTVGGGALADDPFSEEALLQKAGRIATAECVQYIELRGGTAPEGWHSKSNVYAGFVADIPADRDDNLKQIPRKKRADLRKAIKKAEAGDLKVTSVTQTREFYNLYAESVRNLGTPVWPEKLLKIILEAFPDETEILVAKAEGHAVAALVSFYFGDTVLPYYAGAGFAARKLHAYDYLYWEQMRRAHEKGCGKFDFGRSKVGTGAYAYKTHWGFEPKPLSYHYHLVKADAVPDVNPNNPKFRLVTKVWQKLPLPVANRLGPVLASSLA